MDACRRGHVMSDALVSRIVTESKAVLENWKLQIGLGNLIVLKVPAELPRERVPAVIEGVSEWWGVNAPYYQGAKLIVLMPGMELGVQTEENLRQLGYVRAEEAK